MSSDDLHAQELAAMDEDEFEPIEISTDNDGDSVHCTSLLHHLRTTSLRHTLACNQFPGVVEALHVDEAEAKASAAVAVAMPACECWLVDVVIFSILQDVVVMWYCRVDPVVDLDLVAFLDVDQQEMVSQNLVATIMAIWRFQHADELAYRDDLLGAVTSVVDRMSRSHEKVAAALNELKYFRERIGSFGDPSAIASRQKLDPELGEMELDEEADDPDDPPRPHTFLVSAIERMQADATTVDDSDVTPSPSEPSQRQSMGDDSSNHSSPSATAAVVVVVVVLVVVVACAFHWSRSSRMLPKMVEITVLH
ncbi:hypothetical protein Taro_033928 [Colocasia esculenta]|uniref:Uncharacterized protein n=1 Tax=Colocasia esculenta TaxID=4460 RepID=A0A843VWH3_COLES|nr:hypothetical protein [Colocasia esculenta]